MSRPKKLALEGMAGVLRNEMKPDGELVKLMESLPVNEQSHFQAAVWAIIKNLDGRADRTPNVEMPKRPSVKEAMEAAKASMRGPESAGE